MRLIITEKKSVAAGIADVLGRTGANERDAIECCDTTITWCTGHLLEQADPESYIAGGVVRPQDLPVVPTRWQLTPRDDRARGRIGVIKALLKTAREVVHAGDDDREGQLLVDELLIHLGWSGKTLRLWSSSLDEESVKRALASLKPNASMHGLYQAALARQRADWLLGLNGSIALSRKLKSLGLEGGWSIGRVQTPTLALIVDRQAQIEGHTRQAHYQVQITLADGVRAAWQIPEDLLTDGLLLDKTQAARTATAVEGKTGAVVSWVKRNGTRAAPLPYSLSALQMEANSRLGYSAQETLDAAQALYEAKVTTYPRSDCRYLPEAMHGQAKQVLASVALAAAVKTAGAGFDPERRHAAWNTAQVTAHHAIVPTGNPLPPSLTTKARELFVLIVESYVRLFMSDEQFEQRQAFFRFGDNLDFKATARKVLQPGWTVLDKETPAQSEKDDGQGDDAQLTLPGYTEGQTVECSQAEVQAQQTQPPKPYNDKTLIAAMTGIHKLVIDPRLKARLKETSGIGTEATRAGIIETLIARGYTGRKGKEIHPSPRGIRLIALVRTAWPEMADPGATAVQEDALTDIATARLAFESFMEAVVAKAHEEVQALLGKGLDGQAPAMPECPACRQQSAARRTSKAGQPYWKCLECQAAFGDGQGKPGKAFEKTENASAPAKPKPEAGPPCPRCKQKTAQFLTRNGKPYLRCGPCGKNYWPGLNDAGKIGQEWGSPKA